MKKTFFRIKESLSFLLLLLIPVLFLANILRDILQTAWESTVAEYEYLAETMGPACSRTWERIKKGQP